jgi:CubicO group peptidase (beta-lactamase class C family)
VSKLLPDDFVLENAQTTEEVTVEDILSHRTGIAGHDDSYLSIRAKHPDNARSITRNVRNLQLVKPIRSAHIYSNIMFTVASHLVETVSGIPYPKYLRQKLWEPLEMTNTFHDLQDIEAHNAMDRIATGYQWNNNKEEHVVMPAYAQPEGQGAGCIFSSAGDYAKWIRAMIKRSPPLSEAAYRDLIIPRSIMPIEEKFDIPFGSLPLYALGLVRETYRGRTLISHGGSVPGFRSTVCFMPDVDWGLVIFGNGDDAYFAQQALEYTLIDELIGVPKEERVDWLPFFRNWYEIENADDDEEEDLELSRPDDPSPLSVSMEKLVGTYHNAGYKDLVLEIKDGAVVADCKDRCFPFVLAFEHLTEDKFVVTKSYVWIEHKQKLRGKVRVEGNAVTALAVGLEEDIEDHLIWFDRVLS